MRSVRAVLARSGIAPADIAGVGLTGQMPGLCALDAAGVALLAGMGVYRSVVDAGAQTIRITGSTVPGPAVEVYEAYYPRYRALYPLLAGEFAALAGLP